MSIEDIVERSTGHLSRGHCITGGEPTIHKDLPALLSALKESGSGHINLNTNGAVPSMLVKCLPHLDSIWLDVKTTPEKYKEIARTKTDQWNNVERSINLTLDSDVQLWPRTTFVGGLMEPQELEAIAWKLHELGFSGTYLIQNYIDSQGVREAEKSHLYKTGQSELEFLLELEIPKIKIELVWR
jgi:pyruvate formate lyase activating enzyme